MSGLNLAFAVLKLVEYIRSILTHIDNFIKDALISPMYFMLYSGTDQVRARFFIRTQSISKQHLEY